MQAKIERAVSIIRESSQLNDEELYRALTDAGFDQSLAARLVEFLPAAYCRVLLRSTGARFPDTFRRRRADGTISPPNALESEPIWGPVMKFAQEEVERGISVQEKLQIAGRSAEFHAVNNLLNRGATLEDVALTPAILPWPDRGPDAMLPLPMSSKRWWKFWK